MSNQQNRIFRDLEKRIETIAGNYFLSKQTLKRDGFLCSDEADPSNFYAIYIRRVEEAFESLNQFEKKIINSDFFYDDYPFWWVSACSRSTYYRLKKKAMKKFVGAFNHV